MPAITEPGPEFVTLRSACVGGGVTVVMAVLLLLPPFESPVAELIEAVSLMGLDALALTLTTMVNVALVPAFNVAMVHCTLVLHVKLGPVF